MIATALQTLSNVGADENLQVEVENFILTFFNYSNYAKRLPVFVDEVKRKLSLWRKDYNPEELGLTKIEDLFQSYVENALRTARNEIDVEFTLLRTQTTAKHSEVRKEVVGVPSFEHSEDFRSVSYSGKTYTLTPKQAQSIKILFEAQERKMPDVAQDYILNEVSPSSSQKRLRDIFKRNLKVWKALIEPGDKKGTFRLKK
jgi:hypothetical protein